MKSTTPVPSFLDASCIMPTTTCRHVAQTHAHAWILCSTSLFDRLPTNPVLSWPPPPMGSTNSRDGCRQRALQDADPVHPLEPRPLLSSPQSPLLSFQIRGAASQAAATGGVRCCVGFDPCILPFLGGDSECSSSAIPLVVAAVLQPRHD